MSPKILVVDDDPSMVRTLCDILRLRGYDSVGVLSGDAAVKAASDHSYSFVLMDIMMPGIDGVTALKQIKSVNHDTRVVLMTAHTAEERIAEARRAGALDVLSKPIDFTSLLALLGSDLPPQRPGNGRLGDVLH